MCSNGGGRSFRGSIPGSSPTCGPRSRSTPGTVTTETEPPSSTCVSTMMSPPSSAAGWAVRPSSTRMSHWRSTSASSPTTSGHEPCRWRCSSPITSGPVPCSRPARTRRPAPPPTNSRRSRRAARRVGAPVSRPPINVNFRDQVNPFGIYQPACNDCGNCCSGCNTGAKNTTLMNYLPDADTTGRRSSPWPRSGASSATVPVGWSPSSRPTRSSRTRCGPRSWSWLRDAWDQPRSSCAHDWRTRVSRSRPPWAIGSRRTVTSCRSGTTTNGSRRTRARHRSTAWERPTSRARRRSGPGRASPASLTSAIAPASRTDG